MEFLTNSNYHKEVKKCFDNDEPLDIAVAFWGINAISLLTADKEIRIICNLESTACNPEAIEVIKKYKNIQIKSNEKLHAKVLTQESILISGSANISINGLAMQGNEIDGWIESGIKTKNKTMIYESSQWFNKLWKSSNNISSSDIKKYKEIWKKRRKNRPLTQQKKSLLEIATGENDAFKDREIYFVIYRNNKLSNDAQETFDGIEKEYSSISNQLVCFEGWSELPDNSYIISLYYGRRGKKKIDGIYEMPSEPLVEKFIYEEDSTDGNIKLCFTKKNIYGYTLTKKDKEKIESKIKELWDYGCIAEEQYSCIIPFIKGIKIINKSSKSGKG